MEKSRNATVTREKVFLFSSACERRNLDAQKIYNYLTENGYKIVNDPEEADYIIYFTCGFVKSVSDTCLKMIEDFKKYDAELIIAGCIQDIIGEELSKIFDGRIIPTRDLDRINDIFSNKKTKLGDLEDAHSMWSNFNKRSFLGILRRISRSIKSIEKSHNWFKNHILKTIFGENFEKIFPFNRIYPHQDIFCIFISRGCIHNCSYCAIRKAVGPLKSKPIDECIKEFKLGLEKGFKHFVLEADDIGHYGIDIKSSLPELLDKMIKIEGDYKIELKNFHPMWIIKYVKEFKEILKRKKIKIILLSVQSGNNRILKLMRRPYTKEKLQDTILSLKKVDPELEIGVHLLVGFPTETFDEFKETLDLFEKTPFDFGSIFSFSSQEGTTAAKMEPKIKWKEILHRMKYALAYLRKNNYFACYIKSTKNVYFYRK